MAAGQNGRCTAAIPAAGRQTLPGDARHCYQYRVCGADGSVVEPLRPLRYGHDTSPSILLNYIFLPPIHISFNLIHSQISSLTNHHSYPQNLSPSFLISHPFFIPPHTNNILIPHTNPTPPFPTTFYNPHYIFLIFNPQILLFSTLPFKKSPTLLSNFLFILLYISLPLI